MGASKVSGRALSIPKGLALGASVSMGVTVAISFLGAQLIMNDVIGQEQIGYCSLAALLSGAILGGSAASGRIKRRRMVICALNGCVYFALLLAVTALFFGGQYEGFGVTLLTVMIGSAAAALITGRKVEKKKKHNRKKY